MNKYVNEMEDYLYNHNYISRNKNKDPLKQQELSQERASCIVQKYRTLTEEKDKEIERLKAREQEISKMYLAGHKYASEMEGKYILAKYVIDELEKGLNSFDIKGLIETNNREVAMVIDALKERLKELKEGK